MSINSMAVAYDEKMETLLTDHIRRQSVGILIHFVGVARLVPTRGSECKLRNCVESLRAGLPFFNFGSFVALSSLFIHLCHRLCRLSTAFDGVGGWHTLRDAGIVRVCNDSSFLAAVFIALARNLHLLLITRSLVSVADGRQFKSLTAIAVSLGLVREDIGQVLLMVVL